MSAEGPSVDPPSGPDRTALSVMLIVPDGPAASAWYQSALGAETLWDLGSVAALTIGGAPFLLHEAVPGRAGERSPGDAELTTTRIELFVDDPDTVIARAAAAGGSAVEPPEDHDAPWGRHRQGGFSDPFGHRWSVGDRSPLAPRAGR